MSRRDTKPKGQRADEEWARTQRLHTAAAQILSPTPADRMPARQNGCRHDVIALAPVTEWGAMPIWRCTACDGLVIECDHARQRPTSTGWECIACGRTLLGPPVKQVAR